MKELFKIRSSCRLCGSRSLELVVPIGESPVSEKYHTEENISENQLKVPLDLYFCIDCTHVQLLAVVEPVFLWSNFTFRTADNPELVKHFNDIAKRILRFKPIKKSDLIIDIGSNDGTLLKCFKDFGFNNVLGIDPADDIASEAIKKGVQTLIAFINDQTAEKVVNLKGKASIVTANNVFAHVDDLAEMTNAIKKILAKDGIFIFEVSYLLDVVEKMLLGTIFHEHLCYHSVKSMDSFLLSQGLELIHVERGPEQGGSFVGYAQFSKGPKKIQISVTNLLKLERDRKLDRPETIRGMYKELESVKTNLQTLVSNIREKGKSIAGFGAARAGTTLLSYYEIGDHLDFLVDDNEEKHFKFSPGDKIEVFPSSEIYQRNPDYLIILAWLHSEKIIISHKKYLKQGGTFLKIHPKIEIIDINSWSKTQNE